jgi:formylglycine-generating enzyme required for sulfatase activity
MADKPVNFVSWFDAARVANWYQAGALTYATTVSGSAAIQGGAYTLNGLVSGNAPARNAGAQYWIPTLDEWYKAAYYKGGGTNAGYWDYATQSNTAPTAVTSTATGDGSAGAAGDFANFNSGATWNSQNAGNVTTAGTNGGPGAYGTYDMSGNVTEWNDLAGLAGSNKGARGGAYNSLAASLSVSTDAAVADTTELATLGFRLASVTVAPVPEPSTLAMAATAAAAGAAGWLRRRATNCRH